MTTIHSISKDDVLSYMVDCLAYSREEAESTIGETNYEDFMTSEQIAEMEAFLA